MRAIVTFAMLLVLLGICCGAGAAIGYAFPRARSAARWCLPVLMLCVVAAPLVCGFPIGGPLVLLGFPELLSTLPVVILFAVLACVCAFKPGRAACILALIASGAWFVLWTVFSWYEGVALGTWFGMLMQVVLGVSIVLTCAALAPAGKKEARASSAVRGTPGGAMPSRPAGPVQARSTAAPAVQGRPAAGPVAPQGDVRRGRDLGRYVKNKFFAFCVIWGAILVAVVVEEIRKFDAFFASLHPEAMNSIYVILILLGIHLLVWLAGDAIKFGRRFLRAFGVQLVTIVIAALAGGVVYIAARLVLLAWQSFLGPAVYDFVVGIATFAVMLVAIPMILLGLSARDVFDIWAIYTVLFKDDD